MQTELANKVVVSRTELQEKCSFLQKSLNNNSQVDSYRNAHLVYQGGNFVVYAFDGAAAASVNCAVSSFSNDNWIAAVSMVKLFAAVEKLRGDTVEIVRTESETVILCDEVTATIPNLNFDINHVLVKKENIRRVGVDTKQLLTAVQICHRMSSESKSVQDFSGVMLSQYNVYSTDGHRFTKIALDAEENSRGFSDMLISIGVAKKIGQLKVLDNIEQTEQGLVLLTQQGVYMPIKKACDYYPFSVFPKFQKPAVVRLPSGFATFLASAVKFSKEKEVSVGAHNNLLYLRMGRDLSTYDAAFDWDQEEFSFRIQSKYLQDALKISSDIDISMIDKAIVRFLGDRVEHIVGLVV